MKVIDRLAPDQPEIYLYESIEELRNALGYPHVHGIYEPSKNRIHATPISLAHELAHFKDHLSGNFKDPENYQGEKRIQAHIRNEAVAVLFAWLKQAQPKNFLDYEKEFLDLAYYAANTLNPPKDINCFKFSEIQSFIDWLCLAEHSWHQRLRKIFEHYWKEKESYSHNLRINLL